MDVIKAPMLSKIFHTDRLTLKPTSTEDAAFQLEIMNKPKWIANIGQRNVHTIDDAKDYIKSKMLKQYQALGYGNYTIFITEGLVPIGSVGLYNRDGLEGIDFGFALLPAYEKKGYIHEASTRLLRAASENFNLHSLKAITLPTNIESQNVLKKLGFIFKNEKKMENGEILKVYEVTID
jgi:RimJ/RimL family protein N-acetyltransferase